jgi:hypothetical protein
MSKLANLIIRLIYPYKKKIKTNYEIQSSIDPVLNDGIEKKFN